MGYQTVTEAEAGNAETLQQMPVPAIARQYYEEEDPFLFDTFCATSSAAARERCQRRPPLHSLYDVFVNIREDERERWTHGVPVATPSTTTGVHHYWCVEHFGPIKICRQCKQTPKSSEDGEEVMDYDLIDDIDEQAVIVNVAVD